MDVLSTRTRAGKRPEQSRATGQDFSPEAPNEIALALRFQVGGGQEAKRGATPSHSPFDGSGSSNRTILGFSIASRCMVKP